MQCWIRRLRTYPPGTFAVGGEPVPSLSHNEQLVSVLCVLRRARENAALFGMTAVLSSLFQITSPIFVPLIVQMSTGPRMWMVKSEQLALTF